MLKKLATLIFTKKKMSRSSTILCILFFIAFHWGCFLKIKLFLLESDYLDTADTVGKSYASVCFRNPHAEEKYRELILLPTVTEDQHWFMRWLGNDRLRAHYKQTMLKAFEKRLERLKQAEAQKEKASFLGDLEERTGGL